MVLEGLFVHLRFLLWLLAHDSLLPRTGRTQRQGLTNIQILLLIIAIILIGTILIYLILTTTSPPPITSTTYPP